MKVRKRVTNQKGFTLIELMIVVGIIGILVAIAAPNFARYQSKARQSEAKIGLAAIYAGEKSFYSEYSAYAANVDVIGYVPEGNKRYYDMGFNSMDTTSVSGFPTGQLTAAAQSGVANATNFSFPRVNFPAGWTNCTPTLAAGTAGGTDPQAFVAAASGQIRQDQTCDNWTIDDKKATLNTKIAL